MKTSRLWMLIASIGLVVGILTGCGGGGSSSDGGTVSGESTTGTIGTTGGSVALPSGFTVTFPEGSVSASTSVSIAETATPSPLPSGFQAVSSAFKITAGVDQLNLPAELSFPSMSSSSGNLGVFRWDETENQWKYAGGIYNSADGTITTQVDGFSVYIIGAGGLVFKPVDFMQIGSFNMTVRVSEYEFDDPNQTPRLAVQASRVVWKPGTPGDISPNRMVLPQGKYSFCADWWDDGSFGNAVGWYHKFVGDLPNSPVVWLGETSNEVVPPVVTLGDTVAPDIETGRCPVAVSITLPVSSAQQFDFVGTYNILSLDPSRTYDEYHAIFQIKSDNTFTFEEWIWSYYQSGSGTWSFNETTKVFSFSVENGGAFSGTVTGTTDTFDLTGTWGDGTPGAIRLSRP